MTNLQDIIAIFRKLDEDDKMALIYELASHADQSDIIHDAIADAVDCHAWEVATTDNAITVENEIADIMNQLRDGVERAAWIDRALAYAQPTKQVAA